LKIAPWRQNLPEVPSFKGYEKKKGKEEDKTKHLSEKQREGSPSKKKKHQAKSSSTTIYPDAERKALEKRQRAGRAAEVGGEKLTENVEEFNEKLAFLTELQRHSQSVIFICIVWKKRCRHQSRLTVCSHSVRCNGQLNSADAERWAEDRRTRLLGPRLRVKLHPEHLWDWFFYLLLLVLYL
jgi:hypothetical protein